MLPISNFSIKKQILSYSAGLLLLAGCNKDLPQATPVEQPVRATSPTLASLLDDANYSIFKSAVAKAGLTATLSDASLNLTVFAPDNAALIASGISQAAVDALPATTVAGLVSYHIAPQLLPASAIPVSFPNLQYPSMLNPAPAISPLLRLSVFPSKRGTTAWVNNIPISGEATAVNGVLQKVVRAVAPPSQYLWDRINADPNLTYMKAAIIRADSGLAAAASLQGYLANIGANFTVFAPTDAAFKLTLTGAITQGLMATGVPAAVAMTQATALASSPTVFSNPALYSVLTATTVKGIAVYHILGSRAFSVNLPSTATSYPTLLNGAIAVHPGVSLQATMGLAGVTAATVKGLGNTSAANVQINPTPAPGGTSDQHYLNGVLHVIDQVLLPQ